LLAFLDVGGASSEANRHGPKRARAFASIAIGARGDEIALTVIAALSDSDDVIDLKQHLGRMPAAILAPELVTLEHLEPQRAREWPAPDREVRHAVLQAMGVRR
jgi:hypothetical protein